MESPFTVWLWRFLRRYDSLKLLIDQIRNKCSAKIWGVKLGLGCIVYGKISYQRQLGSHISIGDSCRFRSATTANRVGLNRPCMITTLASGAIVQIGNHVGMSGTVIAAAKSIIIEDNVICGGNVTITDTDWHGIHPDQRHLPGEAAPVVIEKNVWLGLNVVVLKGVRIGCNTVVGAGSVVTRSLPPNVIAGGVPAKVLKAL